MTAMTAPVDDDVTIFELEIVEVEPIGGASPGSTFWSIITPFTLQKDNQSVNVLFAQVVDSLFEVHIDSFIPCTGTDAECMHALYTIGDNVIITFTAQPVPGTNNMWSLVSIQRMCDYIICECGEHLQPPSTVCV